MGEEPHGLDIEYYAMQSELVRLTDENDKLRELARRNWFIALSERDALRIHGVNPDDGAYITALDETIDEARATMQELGIEVDE